MNNQSLLKYENKLSENFYDLTETTSETEFQFECLFDENDSYAKITQEEKNRRENLKKSKLKC